MDLAKVLNKIKGFSGVIGYVIVDNQSNVVHTSLDKDDAIKLGAIVIKMVGDGTEAIREYDDNTIEYLRIRSKKNDILIVPGSIYSFAVLRDPNVLSN